MTKRELARERNWFKFILTGTKINCKHLTEEEKTSIAVIKEKVEHILKNFSNSNIKLGLKK